jgi:hypothetical protein
MRRPGSGRETHPGPCMKAGRVGICTWPCPPVGRIGEGQGGGRALPGSTGKRAWQDNTAPRMDEAPATRTRRVVTWIHRWRSVT